MKKIYVPERGDIVWVGLSPTRGHEQSGLRPVVVLTKRTYNDKSGLAIVCPITSKQKQYPFEIRVETSGVQGFILADHARSIDWRARGIRFAGYLPPLVLSEISAIVTSLASGT